MRKATFPSVSMNLPLFGRADTARRGLSSSGPSAPTNTNGSPFFVRILAWRDRARRGFPDYGPGDELKKRPGKIIARPTKHGVKLIEVSATLPDGISGGLIVNDRYQVVGIAQRGGHQEAKPLAVDISELLRLATE